jgi:acyl-CoA thioesterase I
VGAWVRRPVLVGAVVVALLASTLTVLLAVGAIGSRPTRCERFAADSHDRAAAVSGSGTRILVIGDSWSAGLGLDRPADSWPSRLPGRVRVAGFSGSGFAEHASDCPQVAFADRAPRALRRPADLVVVQGGLNDYDQPDADVRAGFVRLMRSLDGQRVVVVGPASAPARARRALHVDLVLAGLAARFGVPYVPTASLDLSYLPDRLHLTPAGHRAFGDYVAHQLAELE